MAVAFNSAADLAGSDATSSLTVAYTLGTGSNLLVVVVDGSDSVDDVTGATYATVPMSLAWKLPGVAGQYDSLYMFYLLAPSSGTNNVVISASTSHRIRAVAADYTGASQSNQPDATSSGDTHLSPGVASYTDTVTTVNDSAWAIAGYVGYFENLPPTDGTGSTRRVYGAFYGMPAIFDSNGPISPNGNYSMTINCGGSTTIGGMRIASFAGPVGVRVWLYDA